MARGKWSETLALSTSWISRSRVKPFATKYAMLSFQNKMVKKWGVVLHLRIQKLGEPGIKQQFMHQDNIKTCTAKTIAKLQLLKIC